MRHEFARLVMGTIFLVNLFQNLIFFYSFWLQLSGESQFLPTDHNLHFLIVIIIGRAKRAPHWAI